MTFNELWDKISDYIETTINSLFRKNSLADLVDNTITEFEKDYMNGKGRMYDGDDHIDHTLFRQFLKWLRVGFKEVADRISSVVNRLSILETWRGDVTSQLNNLNSFKASMEAKCEECEEVIELLRKRILALEAFISNKSPLVDAGTDKTIILPKNSVVLKAVCTDPDGDSMTYLWEKISGGSVSMSGEKTLSLSVSGLSEGEYVFRMTATDTNGNKGSDEVRVLVKDQPPAGVVSVKYWDTDANGFYDKAVAKLSSNQDIDTPSGWTKVDDRHFTKEYTSNGNYSVELSNENGNPSIPFPVTEIGKDSGVFLKPRLKVDGDTVTIENVDVSASYSWSVSPNDCYELVGSGNSREVRCSGDKSCQIARVIVTAEKGGNQKSSEALVSLKCYAPLVIPEPVFDETSDGLRGTVNPTGGTGNYSYEFEVFPPDCYVLVEKPSSQRNQFLISCAENNSSCNSTKGTIRVKVNDGLNAVIEDFIFTKDCRQEQGEIVLDASKAPKFVGVEGEFDLEPYPRYGQDDYKLEVSWSNVVSPESFVDIVKVGGAVFKVRVRKAGLYKFKYTVTRPLVSDVVELFADVEVIDMPPGGGGGDDGIVSPVNSKVYLSNVKNNNDGENGTRWASGVVNTEDSHYFSDKRASALLHIPNTIASGWVKVYLGGTEIYTQNSAGDFTVSLGNISVGVGLKVVQKAFTSNGVTRVSGVSLSLKSVEGEVVRSGILLLPSI